MALSDSRQAQDELAQLLEACAPRVAKLLQRHSIPEQDREDLVQEALLAFLLKSDHVVQADAWLVGTIRNQCLLYWRRRRRTLYQAVDYAVLDALAQPQQSSETESNLRHDLSGVLSQISEKCRALLSLRYGYGCDANETADQLGYQKSGIQRLTTRCLDALCRQMVDVGWSPESGREIS